MGKKHVWLAILVLVSISLVYLLPAVAKENSHSVTKSLLKAMEQSGAIASSIEVRTTIKGNSVNNSTELETLGDGWVKRLNLIGSTEGVSLEKGKLVYQFLSKNANFELRLRVIGVPVKSHLNTYLVLTIKGNIDQLQYIESRENSIEEALRATGLIPQFSTCIRGMYSDKLNVDQQESSILSIFSALQAIELERLQDDTVVSISGFTTAWKPFIKINDQKMNLQVATHRDTQSNGTRITVGTPIITAEY